MKYLSIAFIILFFFSCNSDKTGNTVSSEERAQISMKALNSKGYELMEQKCFICHFDKPDPSKKDQMIAPPMLRVQEHYKPTYPDKEAFIAAITKWVINPIEEETLMPGAVRKFNLMSKLPYEEADLKLIAEALYDIDFGNMPKMNMHKNRSLGLNNGDKWQLIPDHITQVQAIANELDTFTSDDLIAYNKLGQDVFDNAKVLLLEKSYSEELFEELHTFFNGVEGNIHLLIGAQSIDDAKKQQDLLKDKFNGFSNYFE